MKYIITLCLLLMSQPFAADTSTIDEFRTPEAINAALAKAAEELTVLIFDDKYYRTLRHHYMKKKENNLTAIITGNFAKYYLVGTCDLHELLAIAQVLETNKRTLISLPGEPDYQSYNRTFFKRFLTLFYSF